MTRQLFIDDERFPPEGKDFAIVRSSAEAIEFVKINGCPSFISFDHDLGGDDTSMKFIWWLIDSHLDGNVAIPENFSFYVHSQNPIGARNITELLNGFIASELTK